MQYMMLKKICFSMTLISYEATVLDCRCITPFKVNIILMRFKIPCTLVMKIVPFVDIVIYKYGNTKHGINVRT